MERSAEFWRGADWQWVHDARRVDIAEELADAEAREAGKRDYLGEARQAAIELANKLAQEKIAAAEVIAAAEKALNKMEDLAYDWANAASGPVESRIEREARKEFETTRTDALAVIARWKEANHAK